MTLIVFVCLCKHFQIHMLFPNVFSFSGTPEPPVLQATPLGPTSIAVSWNMLSSVTYQLRYRMQGGNTWIPVSDNIPSDETARTLTELTANRVYEIEIRATTIEGNLPSPPNSTLAMTSELNISTCHIMRTFGELMFFALYGLSFVKFQEGYLITFVTFDY